jgi:predicted transcriptional regulator of viral defense system
MSKINDDIKGLSEHEVRVLADLEFREKRFFTREDIKHHFDSDSKISYFIHRLKTKKRIIKLNRNKYYFVPFQSRTGRWSEEAFIIADEMMNGSDYYIGGWSSAYYWKLTDQVPMKTEIYTNKRGGFAKILTENFLFKKTTQKRIDNAVVRKIKGHPFRILSKTESKKWLTSKN